MENLYKEFIYFLWQENSLCVFERNYCNQKGDGELKSVKSFTNKWREEPDIWIPGAFLWEDTREGHPYWQEIHNKWQRVWREKHKEL